MAEYVSLTQTLRWQRMRRDVLMLCYFFPKSFAQPEGKTLLRPLKRDIHRDLFEAAERQMLPLSRTRIRRILYWYTRRPHYRRAVSQGHARVDLEGRVVEEATKTPPLCGDTQRTLFNASSLNELSQ